jgi:BNR repeat-like domain
MGSVRASGFRALGVDTAYAAFPSVCRFAGGQLRLVWRQGTDHASTRDGKVYTATSSDTGRTWGAASIAVTDTVDLRDPCISTAGGTTWLTYFKGTNALPAAGAFLRVSTDDGVTWGSEVRIDSQAYAAICAPVVQLGSTLLAAYYGKNAVSDAFDSCWLASSTDGGATWTRQLVANGLTAGRDYQEPWLIARGTQVWMFFRYGGASAIGAATSTDSGATWSAPTQFFDDATGRPAAVWLSNGNMAVVSRRISDKQAVVRSRVAGSATTAWLPPRPTMIQPASGPIGMLYAHPLEIPGGIICPVGIESSNTVGRIHVGWLADEGGLSPLGDLIPDDRTAVADGLDQVLVAEGFSQANGNLRAPWVVGAGGVQANNGYAVSTAADGVVDLAWQDMGTADVELEGEFSYTGNAGYGLIARVVAANTYLLYTFESSGSAVRLYKIISGIATLVTNGSFATIINPSAWTKLRMVVRGNIVQCFINGWPTIGNELTGSDATLFAGQARHGIKLNAAPGGVHRCRRFIARS